jgi:hypothetical protein
MVTINEARQVAAIVRDAGGRIVGRTRLQKIAFILESVGLGEGFAFKYRHYGPYSDELSTACRIAVVLDLMEEREQPASWGGLYSTFSTNLPENQNVPDARRQIARETACANAVELELAATALYLAQEGVPNPWVETERRKPDKAAGRLSQAQALYEQLRRIQTPRRLPQL